jgi:anti-sigma-K factor RskA
MDYSRPDLAERLAADYVAGTLRGQARRRLEALLPAHPHLRDAVRTWQARLMPLTVAVEPVEPPPAVWQRIEQRIGGTTAAATTPRESLWQRLALWRGLSAFATLAALGFAVLLAMPAPSQPPMVVVLAGTSGEAQGVNAFVAGVSADGRSVVTRPIVPVNLQADRALELWAVPPQGAPRSLGLISEKSASVVQRSRVPPGTAALAVSLEPPQGSPTGIPTGPILYVGKLTL